MSRRWTSGAEIYVSSTITGVTDTADGKVTGANFTRDTAFKRSGVAAWKYTGLAGGPGIGNGVNSELHVVPDATNGNWKIVRSGVDEATNLGATRNQNQWYRIELKFTTDGNVDINSWELKIDGTTVGGAALSNPTGDLSTSLYGTFTDSSNFLHFYLSSLFPDTAYFMRMYWFYDGTSTWLDDFAVNDDVGTDQISYPGEGKVVLLLPISDNQVGDWRGGAGGSSDLWEAINNTPPVGTATETDTSQIESDSTDSAADGPTETYKANLTTYTSAGLIAGDVINAMYAVVCHGEDSATGTKNGSVQIISNPAEASPTTFVFGRDTGALGTWPTNWHWITPSSSATITYEPSVTLGTSPVLEIASTSATNAQGAVCFAGVYVDYTIVGAIAGSVAGAATVAGTLFDATALSVRIHVRARKV